MTIPADLDDRSARLYYPVGCLGAPTGEDASRAISEFLSKYPTLETVSRPDSFLVSIVLHAREIRVVQLDEDGFRFTPMFTMVRFADRVLVIGEPLDFVFERDEAETHAGLMVAMAIVNDTPMIPASAATGRALRAIVDRFFTKGVPVPPDGSERWKAGDSLSPYAVANAYQRIAAVEMQSGIRTAFPSEGQHDIEIPQEGSILLLGADGTTAGLERLERMVTKLTIAGHHPKLLRRIPDIPRLNVFQKAVAIALSSQYVIVDDSEPSGHLIEVVKALIDNTTPFVLLRPKGRPSTAMSEPHIAAYKWKQIVEFSKWPDEVLDKALGVGGDLSAEKAAATIGAEQWRTPRCL